MSYKIGLYIRNFIFGVEDSLVSTVGLLSGIAVADTPRDTILLAGVVLIFVEAFSMGVGSFLSEHSAESYVKQSDSPIRHSIMGGAIMLASYFVAGFIPLLPYIFLTPMTALVVSIILSLIALFILGIISARFSKINFIKEGLKMMIVGGIAIALGVIVGITVS